MEAFLGGILIAVMSDKCEGLDDGMLASEPGEDIRVVLRAFVGIYYDILREASGFDGVQ